MAKKISELHMFQDFNCFAENDKNLKQIVFEVMEKVYTQFQVVL